MFHLKPPTAKSHQRTLQTRPRLYDVPKRNPVGTLEYAHGDSREEKLPFNRRKPPAEPETVLTSLTRIQFSLIVTTKSTNPTTYIKGDNKLTIDTVYS